MWNNQYPTLEGFQTFVSDVMAINPLYLPVGSAIIGYSFHSSMAIVNEDLRFVPGGIYAQAVYNLAASELITFAQDQEGRTYFRDLRDKLKISAFTPGVIASTSDSTTAESLLNPEFIKHFTMQNLQSLKDPYGRKYLGIAQSYGPNIWGVS